MTSFYFIYFIFLFSAKGVFSFSSVYCDDYSFGILIQYIPQLRSAVLPLEFKDHKTLNSVFQMSV